jgi:radical SAM superfamily enzyme YgiQ (UPF0313 family)
MRIAAHHRQRGDEVSLRVAGNERAIEAHLWEKPDKVYASAIFSKTLPVAQRLKAIYPDAIIGGTGWSITDNLEQYGISTNDLDYSIYPRFRQSMGFTQRGCRLKCEFCVVPQKEGKIRAEKTINEIWRGEGFPRELLLLDNDFFGQPEWRTRILEIRSGGFKVSFNQGINCRCLTEEAAEAIASVEYRDDSMQNRRIYKAWDSKEDAPNLYCLGL